MNDRIQTRGALIESGYRARSVRQEMRENLVEALRARKKLFPGIIGFEDTVEPAIVNALLAGHDLILLGLRGQAKSRILRSLTRFLDDSLPVIDGAPLHEDPSHPISAEGRRIVAEAGDDTPIRWLSREERYREKLATPDVNMADLVGDIDPIRAARRGESIVDDEAIAYGLIPRSNRGLFAINELPDLSPRIQVALLNVMEERDVQIRGFPLRLPLDLVLLFSANPEDYTKRGNLITPLRDRIAAQIHTHYPVDIPTGVAITRQEARAEREGTEIIVPEIARELVEAVAVAARASDWIDQSSGVSARLTISLLETVVSNAEARALRLGVAKASVRVGDFFAATPALVGKVELVFEGEREGAERVAEHLVGQAVKAIFDRDFPDFFADAEEESPYAPLVEYVRGGAEIVTDTTRKDEDLLDDLDSVPGLTELCERFLPEVGDGAALFARELVLEGLHQHSALAKDLAPGRAAFRDLVEDMWKGMS
jgi:magnesium chelatase subunit I